MSLSQRIRVAQSQMSVLLDQEQTDFLNALISNELVYGQCGASGKKEITIHEISRSPANDILIKGRCKICKCRVARLMKHDHENQVFYDKVRNLWNSTGG